MVMVDLSVKSEVAKLSFGVSKSKMLVRVGMGRVERVKKYRNGTWKSEER